VYHERYLESLNDFVMQKNKKPVPQMVLNHRNFREDSLVFSDYFAQWKKEVDVFKSPHPYKQFTKPKETADDVDNNSKQISWSVNERFSNRSDDAEDRNRSRSNKSTKSTRRAENEEYMKRTSENVDYERSSETCADEDVDESHDGHDNRGFQSHKKHRRKINHWS